MYTQNNIAKSEEKTPVRGFLSHWFRGGKAKRSRNGKLAHPVKRFFTRGATVALLTTILLLAFVSGAQSAITYRQKSQDVVDNGTSVSPAMPTGTVEGDLMIATVTHDSGASVITPPAGWTLIEPASRGAEQSHTRSYYRVAQSGESGPYTFTADLTNSMIAQIVTFYESTGVDVNGWTLEDSSYKYQEGAASITSTSVTGVANCLFYLAAMDDDNQAVTTPPASMTMLYETLSAGNALATYYEFRGAGAVTKDITWATIDELATIAAVFSWTASTPPTTRTVAIYPSGATPPAGYDATYTSMFDMEAAENADLVALNRFLRVEIVNSDGNWSTADTTAVTFDGWNTDRSAGQYVEIEVMGGARNPYSNGKWSDSHYRLSATSQTLWIDNDATLDNYFEADFIGLQVEASSGVTAAVRNAAYHKTIRFIASHFRNTNTITTAEVFQLTDDNIAEVWFINCIFENPNNVDEIVRATSDWVTAGTATAYFYNCTVVGGVEGLDVAGGTITVKNCAVFNNGTTDIAHSGATVDYVASDASVGTNWVDISPGASEPTDWNAAVIDYANGDYRVKDSNSVLYHAGLSQSSDSNVPSVDIVGNGRPTGSNPVSIGAFEYGIYSYRKAIIIDKDEVGSSCGSTTDTWQVSANNRDAWDDGTGSLNTCGFGDTNYYDAGGYQWAVDIPQGATITSAKVRVYSNSHSGVVGAYTARIRVEDVDSAAAFTGLGNDIYGRTYWGTTVDWAIPGALNTGTWSESPDITALIQHVVNKPGWSPGNYLNIAIWGQTANGGCIENINDYSNNPTYAAQLEVTYQTGSGSIQDFPVMVKLTGSDFQEVEDNVDADGYDIIFKAEDDTTCGGVGLAPCTLDHEIEVYDETNDLLIAWVRVPNISVSADTPIYMYYGNPSISSPTENPTGVWDSNYLAVYHMNQDPSGTVYDSTSNNVDLSPGGNMTSADLIDGQIGKAIDFDSTESDRLVSSQSVTFESFTMEAWVEADNWAGWRTIVDMDAGAAWRDFASDDINNIVVDPPQSNIISTNYTSTGWHHIVAKYDDGAGTDRLNGIIDGSPANTANPNFAPITARVIVGAWWNDPTSFTDFWEGRIDEVRISDIARDNCWIETEHSNQQASSTLVSVGGEEPSGESILAEHAAGQESDAFSGGSSVTGAELFAFQLSNTTGSPVTVNQVQFQLSSVTGISDTDFANLEIQVDDNGDGTIDGSDTTGAVGGAGTVDGSVTTITFSIPFNIPAVSTVTYILRGDVSNLLASDAVTIGLGLSNITLASGTVGGTAPTSVTHTNATVQQIALDSTSGGSTNSGLNTLTFQHTIGCGSNRLLVVSIAVEGGATYDVTDVTYNGVSLTKGVENAVGSTYYMNTEIWYMLEAALPSAGTYDVVVTTTGDPTETNINAGAISVTGAAQRLPEATAVNDDAEGGSATIQTDITTSTDGAWIFDSVGSGQPRNFTPFDGRTEFFDVMGASSGGAGTYEEKATAGLETQRWDVDGTSNRISHVLLAFAPAVDTVPANLTQIHYRWRNDDAGEVGGLDTGTGADGSVTISAAQNLNTDILGSNRVGNPDGILTTVSANPTGTSITVASTTGFAAGDEILLINLQGASGDTADVGNYEFLIVNSVPNGTTLDLTSAVQKSYDGTSFANQEIVVQRVPQWTNVTIQIGGTLTANAWDGTSGGIIVFRATGTLDIQTGGTISVNGLGYVGGNGATVNDTDGFQGESDLGTGSQSPVNNAGAGGGGDLTNVGVDSCGQGGGGGGYGSVGTVGDYGSSCGGTWPQTNAGTTYGVADLSKIYLGSGGGGGAANDNNSSRAGNGAIGAGIVIILADTINVDGNLQADGGDGEVAPDIWDNGNGGGGSGGSIYLAANSATLSVGSTTASGGNGGPNTGDPTWNGAGGDGGVGRIRIEADSITGTTTPAASTAGTPGSGPGATFAEAEDTKLTGLSKGSTIRLRFEVSNEGGQNSNPATYQLQVAETATCGSGTYSAVPTVSTDHWQIVDSIYITDAEATQNIDPGLSDEETTFVPGELKDGGNTTGSIALDTCEFTEIEFVLQATSNATDGGDYCFRLYDTTGGSTLDSYAEYAAASIAGAANLTQIHYRWRNDDAGESPSRTIVYQKGDGKGSVSETDDASLRSDNPTLNYGADAALLVDNSPDYHAVIKFPNIFGGGADQIPLGSTITSATLTVEVYDAGTDIDVYQLTESWIEGEVSWTNRVTGTAWSNVGADGTLSHKTTADDTFANGSTGTKNINVTTSVQNWSSGEANEGWVLIDTSSGGVDIRSSEYGTIASRPKLSVTYVVPTATFAEAEDTKLTDLNKGTTIRLRFAVSNEGILSSGGVTYQLQVAETGTCGSGSYTAVPTDSSGHWQIVDSTYITDGEPTVDNPGLTNEATTFVPGEVKDAGNTTGSITLGADEFTEIEFVIQATSNATDGGDYCFRLYDTTGASPLDTYSVYAEASLLGPSDVTQIHYRWRNDDGPEKMQATETADDTTTSAIDVPVSGMTLTPGAGDYLVWFSGSVESSASSYQYVSLYVGGAKIAHTERQIRTEGSIPNTSFPVATHARIIGVTAGQAIEVQWRTTGGTATMHERALLVVPIVAADTAQASETANNTTGSTIDVPVTGMTLFPPSAGDYHIWFSGSVECDTGNTTQYASLYVNGSRIPHTERRIHTEGSIAATSFPVATHARVTGLTAGQAIEVQWRTTGTSTATMHQRTLVISKINAADSTQASATADDTTGSATDVLVTGMTLTPGAGDYRIWFSGSVEGTAQDSTQYVSLYVNNIQIAHSERQIFTEESIQDTSFPVATHAYVTGVTAAQAVEVRWRTTAGTATMHERTLVIEKVASSGAASFAAAEDTKLDCVDKGNTIRLRFAISNEGAQGSGAVTYQLQVAETATCGSGTYSAVPTDSSGHWQIVDSTYVSDGESTSDNSGLTNEGSTWVDGELRDTGNTTGSITLNPGEFTEIEFALQATTNATEPGDYCFRLYDTTSGQALDTYSVYPEVAICAGPDLTQIHYRWRNDNAGETAPTDWWNSSYLYRKKITFGTSHSLLPLHYTASVTMDTRPAATNVALASGNDVRVVWQPTAGGYVELDRIGDAWNNASTAIDFRLQSEIGANLDEDVDGSYYIYYGNASAGTPPTDEMNVYYFADFFNRADSTTVGNGWTEWTTGGGDSSIASGALNSEGNNVGPPDAGVKQTFPLGAVPGDFTLTFDWTIPSNTEGIWTHYVNIGNSATMADGDRELGVGPGIYTGEGAHFNPNLVENVNNDLNDTTIMEQPVNGGPHSIRMDVDVSAYTYDYYRNGSPIASGQAFVNNENTLNQIRIANDQYSAGQPAFICDNLKIVLNVADVPEEALGTEENYSVSGADFAAAEDQKLTGLSKGSTIRVRFEVSNEGILTSGGVTYQLQVAETATCGSGTYSVVPTDSSGHWQIVDSTYITDGEPTVDNSGLTNEAATWVDGELKDAGNTTGSITLDIDEFTEIEFAIQATTNATDSGDYCFRLYDSTGGTTLNTYSVYAEVRVGGPYIVQTHYRWRNDDGGEGGFDTGTGADGAVIINSSQNINTNVLGSNRSTNADGILTTVSANPAGTSISVASTTGFAAGDEILLINMQGASGDTADVGNYEFLIVDSVPNGTTLNLTTAVQKSYDGSSFANQKIVVQRVPQWTDVTIQSGGTLTANAWDGTNGGVIVFRATGTVDVQGGGTISVNGLGYTPGSGVAVNDNYGFQGESYTGTGSQSPVNNAGAGGGGDLSNVGVDSCGQGGGGGGYGSVGTDGGYGSSCGGSLPQNNAGATYGVAELSKIYLGSGGGGGAKDIHSGAVASGDGAQGAGAVMIFADTITVNGNLRANGANAPSTPASGDNGMGGGGSGGSIYLAANSVTLAGGSTTATGGAGGPNTADPTWIGAGGDGGVGRIRIEADSITGTTSPAATTAGTPGGTGATFAEIEDGKLNGLAIQNTIRLRFLICNQGTQTTGPITYQLQVAETATCGSGTYSAVPTTASGPSDHWEIVDSSYITDGEQTFDNAGLTNSCSTWVDGELRDSDNVTGTITLNANEFTEIEFVLQASEYSTDGGDYCFRLYDTTNGTALGNYAEYAEVQLANGIFSYKKPITIPAANLGSSCSADLDDFPVLISLTDPDLASKAKADGYDIIFRALDDTICDDLAPAPCTLDHEIEKWDSGTGELIAWVRIPKLSSSSDTTIYMYYGNPNVYQSTENAAGVWDPKYVAVWHLAEDPSTAADGDCGGGTKEICDSTSNDNDGDTYGTMISTNLIADGQIGDALDLDGTDDYIEWPLGNGLDITGNTITLTGWARTPVGGVNDDEALINKIGAVEYPYMLGMEDSVDLTFDLTNARVYDGTTLARINATAVPRGAWVYLALRYDGANVYAYVNGAPAGAPVALTGNITSGTAVYSGRRADARRYEGDMDELRVSAGDLTQCWIETEYANQSNPGVFYSVGAEEGTPSTAVSLLSFTAKGQGGSVLVEWETAQEIRNVGFNLYRAESLDGPFTRLNDKLIPGLTFSVRGKAYAFVDTHATRGTLYYYKLEDIDVSGKRTMHGPISVDWDADGMPDDWEIAYGFNPLLNEAHDDLDGDGLTNLEEYEHETDPFNPDSDGDGIPDGQESGKVPRGEPVETRTLTQGVQIVASDDTGVTLELRTDNYEMEVIQVDEDIFQRLRISDYIHGSTSEVGKPELPMKGLLLDLPDGVSATLRVEATESQKLEGYWIYPVPERAVSGEEGSEHVAEFFAIDEAAYSNDTFYPAVVADLGETYVFREQQKLQVRFYPFAFNPKTKELAHYTRIRVRVEYGVASTATRSASRALSLPVPSSPSSSPRALGWTPPSPNPIYKILVSGEGIYRMTGSWLAARGVDVAGMVFNQVRFHNLGQELAIHVYDEDGDNRFDPSDYIEFYGRAIEASCAKYTKQNVYWLTDSGVPGALRMGVIDGTPVSAPVLTHTSTVRHEQDEEYVNLAPGDDSLDRWFFVKAALNYDSEVQAFSNNQIITGAKWGATARIVEVIDQGSTGTLLLEGLSGYFEPGETVTGAYDGEASVVYLRTFVPGTSYTGTPSPVPVDFSINLPGVAGLGSLKVSILGLTESGHEVEVLVNGIPAGTYTWSGFTFKQVAIAGINLLNGDNIVTFRCSGSDPFDALAVDWIEITYPKIFVATNDTIKFSHDAVSAYQVSGFTTSELLAFDITSTTDVRQIGNLQTTDSGGSYTLDMEPQYGTGERTYLVLSTTELNVPIAISEVVDPDLSNGANGADYILITHRDLGWDGNGDPYPWLSDLVALRESQGLRVEVVDVEDIYNEFSYGIPTPQAIKDFLAYAYDNWVSPAPQYVLLVGDSTYDYKDNLNIGTINYVPTYLSWTEYMGETLTDDWFARVSGNDAVPDLYIGRLPAATVGQASDMVNKITTYEDKVDNPILKTWEKNVLLVADDQTADYEALFRIMTNDVAALIPEGMNSPFIEYLADYPDPADLKATIKDKINNEGTLIVNYGGHGSVQIWTLDPIFDVGDVADLTNSNKLPFFVSMTCLTGFFGYPEVWNYPSLAEVLMRSANKGAVAAFMSTGMTQPEGQRILDVALFEAIFKQDNRALGPAISAAKQTLLANGAEHEDVSKTFLLFGDPATKLKVPLPTVPSGLMAQVQGSSVVLSWQGATDCNGGAVAGYNVYQSTTPGGPYTKVNTALITGTGFTDTSAQTGTFYYVVRSVDSDGDESAPSNELVVLAGARTVSTTLEGGAGGGGGGGGCFISTIGN